ncbi:endonuclease NucS domain-containing protein [Novipirellula sp.]|uniref:endonuclease NucS domain-containing protein n=1 Tax=Novipirellula sp. TaxID=2795430 RepID=UPI0035617018
MPYENEAALRDQIANNLTDLEDGLNLIDTEYPLQSRDGAGGRIDILARDRSGQTVIIELKRSNATARQALHELSKYITLMQEQEGLARGELRCLLLSTDWHELLVPYSYFRDVADVDVEGKRLIVGQDDKLNYEDVAPLDVRDLPTFSPEFDLFVYDAATECEKHVALMDERAKQLPFLAAAVVLLKPKEDSALESSLRRSIVCLWRIHDCHHASVETICGFKIGHLYPYAFPGWELECDVLFWLASEDTQLGFPGTAEQQRGTAEKVDNLLEHWEPYNLVHLGRLPNGRTLNDAERVVQLLRGQRSRLPLGRRSPRSLNDTVVSTQAKSWTAATTVFLEFIQDVPVWHEAARSFITSFTDTSEAVQLSIQASKHKHVFYAIYQAREHAKAALSWFKLVARNVQGDFVDGLVGDLELPTKS